jgi:GNAT superfamily N-acetyltransferase
MGPELLIRQAVIADADALFEVHQDAIYGVSASHYGREHMRIWFEGRTSAIYESAIREGRVWLAESDRQILGFVGIAAGEIFWLYVRASAAGLGIGTRLLDLAIRKIQDAFRGPVKVTSLLNAESFYARLGFVKISDDMFERGNPPLSYPVVKMMLALV